MSRGAAPRRSGVWRGDLLDVLRDPARGPGSAGLLGFGERPVLDDWEDVAVRPAQGTVAGALTQDPPEIRDVDVPFWRLDRFEPREPRPDDDPADAVERPRLTSADLEPRDARVPDAPPLEAWPRVWRWLRRVTQRDVPRDEIDVSRLVERVGRGEQIVDLPRHTRRIAATQVWVFVDRNRRLTPFWQDQDAVIARLERALGDKAVAVSLFLAGPDSAPLRRGGMRSAHDPPAASTPVLLLGDLGAYAGGEAQHAWRRRGERLRRLGYRLNALVPCPPERLHPRVARLWRARPWDRGGGPRRAPDPVRARAAADRLLRLVSPAIRVEPGLLRAARLLLPAPDADVGAEYDAWNRQGVAGSAVAMALSRELLRQQRPRWSEENAAIRARFVELMRAWHAPLAPEIWHEEVLALWSRGAMAGAGADVAAAMRFARRAAGSVVEAGSSAGVRGWFRRFDRRVPDPIWRDPDVGEDLRRAWCAVHEDDEQAEPPPGVDPAEFATDRAPSALRWDVAQVGAELACGSAASAAVASPVGVIEFRARQVAIRAGTRSEQREVELRDGFAFGLPEASADLTGPGQPDWAVAFGRDEYGVWADDECSGVRQRFRWIAPTRFWMGSPESEWGRDSDEPRHEVEITTGFWLADTPCTQERWEAMGGENRSRFRGAQRPVETVSFDDVERVIGEHGLGLPSEAEWELACRAGTTPATYAGDLDRDTHGEVLEPIAWYGGNSEQQTHPVMGKRPNAFGLYDVLGNVWEWCRDAIDSLLDLPRQLDGTLVIDPVALGGSRRVVRGGSWVNDPQSVRAAYRFADAPGRRDDYLGFRLARGQDVRSGEGATGGGEGRAIAVAPSAPPFHIVTDRGRWTLELRCRPDWADAAGRDRFGLWADLVVGTARQRLRWIPPGRFRIGSPDTESGRYDDELQHEVILSHGYWLGDTPCTQALWRAVFGSNPSARQGDELPVESVSDDDVTAFLGELPGPDERGARFRLPTEAEWEHACRAGTETATYAGDFEVEDAAGVLDRIAWYEANSSGETRRVGAKEANRWGLYDMFGNVWEWCLDEVEYDDAAERYSMDAYVDGVVDPLRLGGSQRVVRGGSWCSGPRRVRAACRYASAPDERLVDLGFRLARGQDVRSGEGAAGGGEGRAPAAAPPRSNIGD